MRLLQLQTFVVEVAVPLLDQLKSGRVVWVISVGERGGLSWALLAVLAAALRTFPRTWSTLEPGLKPTVFILSPLLLGTFRSMCTRLHCFRKYRNGTMSYCDAELRVDGSCRPLMNALATSSGVVGHCVLSQFPHVMFPGFECSSQISLIHQLHVSQGGTLRQNRLATLDGFTAGFLKHNMIHCK